MFNFIQHYSKRQSYVFIAICLFLFSISSMGAVASTSEGVSIQHIYPHFEIPMSAGSSSTNAEGVSDDGRYVLVDYSNTYIPSRNEFVGQTCSTLYLVDVQTDTVDSFASGCDSWLSSKLSPDGRYVAISVRGEYIIDDEANEYTQLFMYDVDTGSAKLISRSSSGEWGNGSSTLIGMSDDGRHIVFRSYAKNLVPNDTNGREDSFVYDTVNETLTLISLAEEGNFYHASDVSADGRFRVTSTRDALVPDDTNDANDIFVHDSTGAVRRVSVSATNEQGNSFSYRPHISANGRYIAFFSYSTNLVPDAGSGVYMVVNPFMETTTDDTPDNEGECIIPASGPWPECARNGGGTPVQPPADDGETCIIPASGRWPECARNGGGTPAQPPVDVDGECIIPVSGPWPECAKNGKGTPAQPTTDGDGECIIPASGRWPECARNGNGTPAQQPADPVDSDGECIIPVSGRWPACARNGGGTPAQPPTSVDDGNTVSIQQIYRPPLPRNQYGSVSADPVSVSDDGRYVLIEELSTTGDDIMTYFFGDLMLLDTQQGTQENISQESKDSGFLFVPPAQLSPDGRYVVVAATGEQMIKDEDTNPHTQIFLHDVRTSTVKAISLSPSGERGDGYSTLKGVSGDGRYIVFRSVATNLVPNDTNGGEDSFVYDTVSETLRRISLAEEESFYRASDVSANGRFRVTSTRDALVSDDTNDREDVFVQDLTNGSIRRVSVSATNEQGDGVSDEPHISANGRYIVFNSSSSNLVSDSRSGWGDVFMVENPFMETATDGTQETECTIPASGPWPECARK